MATNEAWINVIQANSIIIEKIISVWSKIRFVEMSHQWFIKLVHDTRSRDTDLCYKFREYSIVNNSSWMNYNSIISSIHVEWKQIIQLKGYVVVMKIFRGKHSLFLYWIMTQMRLSSVVNIIAPDFTEVLRVATLWAVRTSVHESYTYS